MLIYLFRRLGAAILTLWLAVTLAFIALRIIPGDAIAARLAQVGATPAQIAARRAALGLDQPLIIQYGQMLGGLARGDLGRSLVTDRPVGVIIGEQFGATVVLATGALIVAMIVGIGLGILSAVSSSPLLRHTAGLIVALLLSAPVYWSGTLAIYWFSLGLRILPATGSGDWTHLILPWLALGLSIAGSIARVTAANLREVRGADFIRTARSKGLAERQVVIRHMLRASLGPILTVIALQTGFLLGGMVITETLFVRQGIGQVMLNAIEDKDYPVVQGIVVLSAITYSLVNTAADLLVAALDPRVRLDAATAPAA
ncbi:MAG: ABC transporter permease [Anaerolineae bacterium]|nr:ABC transporter permease [Anaerolineae bacterium]